MKRMEIGIWFARAHQPTPTESAAEKGSQRRSRLANILNVPQRVRLRCLLRLRPSCETFLSSL